MTDFTPAFGLEYTYFNNGQITYRLNTGTNALEILNPSTNTWSAISSSSGPQSVFVPSGPSAGFPYPRGMGGFLGYYRGGNWRTFLSSGTFIVPAGVTSIRVRVVGGGAGASGFSGSTTSFGALISATGGGASAGGSGIGGDFQANGGGSAAFTSSIGTGGGGAGSQLGNGGDSGTGGGGVGGGTGGGTSGPSGSGGGGSAYGVGTPRTGAPDAYGNVGSPTFQATVTNITNSQTVQSFPMVARFPFEFFLGKGGGPGADGAASCGNDGGSGGGGGASRVIGGNGGWGGGGGGCGTPGTGGGGGIGGGGGGVADRGGGGGGFAIGVFTVVPGTSYFVTVATPATSTGGPGGPGLCVVEW